MPLRLSKLATILEREGIRIEKPKSGGSHWKAKRKGDGAYPLPAHNGAKTEIDDVYLDGLARHFGLAEGIFQRDRKKQKAQERQAEGDAPVTSDE